MPCPKCGGSHRVAIGPNYWQCRSVVSVFNEVPVGERWDYWPANPETGAPATPFLRTEHETQMTLGVCSHRYRDGSSIEPACACGRYIAGSCVRCGQPTCEEHRTGLVRHEMVELAGGQLLCPTHSDEARRELEQSQVTAQAAARAADEARFDSLLRGFVDAAARLNYPGAVAVHHTEAVTGLQKVLTKVAWRSGEFRCQAWDLGFTWERPSYDREFEYVPSKGIGNISKGPRPVWLLAEGMLARVGGPGRYGNFGDGNPVYDHHYVDRVIVAPPGHPGARPAPFEVFHDRDLGTRGPDMDRIIEIYYGTLKRLVREHLPVLAARLGIPLPSDER